MTKSPWLSIFKSGIIDFPADVGKPSFAGHCGLLGSKLTHRPGQSHLQNFNRNYGPLCGHLWIKYKIYQPRSIVDILKKAFIVSRYSLLPKNCVIVSFWVWSHLHTVTLMNSTLSRDQPMSPLLWKGWGIPRRDEKNDLQILPPHTLLFLEIMNETCKFPSPCILPAFC